MKHITDIRPGHTVVLVVNEYERRVIGNHGFSDEQNINRGVDRDNICAVGVGGR